MVDHSFSHREEYQRKKRTTQRIRIIVGVVLFSICIAISSFVAYRSSIRISNVTLTGGVLVSQSEVSDETMKYLSSSYVFLYPKNNIFIYPKNGLEQDLKNNFKRIDTISITRINFHTLNVSITERKPVALWCDTIPDTFAVASTTESQTGQCYFMDDTSTIFALAPSFSGDAYFKYYGTMGTSSIQTDVEPIGLQYIASSTSFTDISKFVEYVSGLGLHPQYLVSSSNDEYTLVIGGGGKLLFDTNEPLSKVGQNLQALLLRIPELVPNPSRNLPIDYIDLRYGNKLFYKLSGQATSTKQ